MPPIIQFPGDHSKKRKGKREPQESGDEQPKTVRFGADALKGAGSKTASEEVRQGANDLTEGLRAAAPDILKDIESARAGKKSTERPDISAEKFMELLDDSATLMNYDAVLDAIGPENFDYYVHMLKRPASVHASERLRMRRQMDTWDQEREVLPWLKEADQRKIQSNPIYYLALFRQGMINEKRKDDQKMLEMLETMSVPKDADAQKEITGRLFDTAESYTTIVDDDLADKESPKSLKKIRRSTYEALRTVMASSPGIFNESNKIISEREMDEWTQEQLWGILWKAKPADIQQKPAYHVAVFRQAELTNRRSGDYNIQVNVSGEPPEHDGPGDKPTGPRLMK